MPPKAGSWCSESWGRAAALTNTPSVLPGSVLGLRVLLPGWAGRETSATAACSDRTKAVCEEPCKSRNTKFLQVGALLFRADHVHA